VGTPVKLVRLALLLLYWYKIEKVFNLLALLVQNCKYLRRRRTSACTDPEAPPLQWFSYCCAQRFSLLIRTGAYIDLKAPPVQLAQRARIYLLYWYKSTNTEAEDAADLEALPLQTAQRALPLSIAHALLSQDDLTWASGKKKIIN
jgi:hypothetical protein